ncbi:MAG: hypothetical protein Q8O99_01115 [bacterium]|nr:hypothetical protein [bacterium]
MSTNATKEQTAKMAPTVHQRTALNFTREGYVNQSQPPCGVKPSLYRGILSNFRKQPHAADPQAKAATRHAPKNKSSA